ncbi:MAG: T9SS type A sorting domain-containing protein [Bacteroidota bacterium]
MKTELYLQIPKPCHENWDAMTPVDKGRFCASCSKEVVDFSLLSDVEVLNFFKRSTGNTCGRFNVAQLERPLQETKIEKKKGWKWAMASITSLIMVSKSQAQKKGECTELIGKVRVEQPKKPEIKKHPVAKRIVGDTIVLPTIQLQPQWLGEVVITASGRKIKLEGMVVNEKNEPLPGATIHSGNDAVIGYADQKGHFEITTSAKGDKLPITFRSIGYIDDHSVIDLIEDEVELKVFMKPKVNILPEVSVISYASRSICLIAGGITSYRSVTKKDTAAAFIRKVLDTPSPFKILTNPLKIYPNPAIKNSIVHLSIKEIGNYQVQLFDNSSRLLQAEENTTTVKRETINLQLPANAASGIYYIRLINIATKKSYTDKLIIQ